MGKIILRLDRVMADRKMSLKELSEKVGVANVNLSKMKTGKISAIRFPHLLQSAKHCIVSRVTFWNTAQKMMMGTIHDIPEQGGQLRG